MRAKHLAITSLLAVTGAAGCLDDLEKFTAKGGAGGATGPGGASSSGDGGATSGSPASSSGAGAGPAMGNPFFRDGSRLEAIHYDFGGGAVQFLSWFDKDLGTECSFRSFSTGDVACVPLATSWTYFTDESCSVEVAAYFPSGCSSKPAHVVSSSGTGTCLGTVGAVAMRAQAITSVHTLGAAASPPALYARSSGACSPTSAPPGTQLFQFGPAVPLASLVAAKIVKEPRGDALVEEVYEGADGSRQLYQPVDEVNQAPCRLLDVGGERRCVPMREAFVPPFFTDGTCTTPAGVAWQKALDCPAPLYARRVDVSDDGCTATSSYFAVGALASPGALFAGGPMSCVAYTPPAQVLYFKIGASINPTQFALVTEQVSGTGRLQVAFDGTGPDAAVGQVKRVMDTSSGKPCAPFELVGDGIRCVDVDVPRGMVTFADSACTQPVYVRQVPSCGPVPPLPAAIPIGTSDADCSDPSVPRAEGLRSLKLYTGPVYAKKSSIDCVETTVNGDTYTADAVVPASTFAEVKWVHPVAQ